MSGVVTKAQYDWLAMLFLGGDNDLFQFGQDLLTEAQRVGSTDRVAVVAEHDPTNANAPTIRGQIFSGLWDKENIGQTAGDPKTIVDFIEYAKRKFPAEKRILILWDHGNGWQNVQVFEPITAATRQLRLEDIFDVVDRQPGIGVLCFDSCLMAMIEIAYQLRNKVQYIVASENVVPADTGWPYDSILRTLAMRPHITPAQVVCAIVDGFSGSYNGSDQPVTLSALCLDHVDDAVKAIDVLAKELIAACLVYGQSLKVMFARRYAQSFGNPDYVDIVSFCNELQVQLPDTNVQRAADGVKKAIEKLVIGATRSSAPSVSGANGVSIYFPDRPMSPLYQKLDFATTSTCMWATFIALMAPVLPAPRPLQPRAGRSAHIH